jgi:hypothetical protein
MKRAVTNDERGIGTFEPNLLRAKAKVLLIGAARKCDGGGLVAHDMSLRFEAVGSRVGVALGDCAVFTGGQTTSAHTTRR